MDNHYMTTQVAPVSQFSDCKNKIESRQAQVAVIGLGYVGLPLSMLFTEQKFPVTGFDIDQSKVAKLLNGETYIYRIPATEIQIARQHAFKAPSYFSELKTADAIIISVPPPLDEYHE